MKKFTEELKFAQIIRNRKIDNEIINVLKKSYSINKHVFGKCPKKFKIIICDTEEEIKKRSRQFYRKWSTAYVMNSGELVTRSPEFIEKIGKWNRKDFQNLMDHEINHIFFQNNYGHMKPIWVAEGLACYVGKNFVLNKRELNKIINTHKVNYHLLEHRYLRMKFKQGHYPRYPIWANFTKYIISKYSIKNLINLLTKYSENPNKKNYNKLFRKTFGLSDRRLFNEFLDFVKT